jgi:pantoate--beta-alanine ligase
MQIFEKIKDLQDFLSNQKSVKRTIGFVPTMGALHQGHISLVEKAKKENDIVVVSIFVNPTQFNSPTDLQNYPRTLETDYKLLRDVYLDAVFSPEVDEIYSGENEKKSLDIGLLGNVMEGFYRPGHFDGVIQVVARLFEIVQPQKAYFGEKDFQQLAVIKYMVKAFQYDIEIIACPTMRESNGLAMSSRNQKLSEKGKENAKDISKALFYIHDHWEKLTPNELRQKAEEMIKSNIELNVEYIEIADEDNLQPVNSWNGNKHVRSFAAVFCEGIRLIDNVQVF